MPCNETELTVLGSLFLTWTDFSLTEKLNKSPFTMKALIMSICSIILTLPNMTEHHQYMITSMFTWLRKGTAAKTSHLKQVGLAI